MIFISLSLDGNLVLYDSQKELIWSSQTPWQGRPSYHLILKDDGSLVLFDGKKNPLWNSGTNQKSTLKRVL